MTHIDDDNKLLEAMKSSNLKGVSLEQIKKFVKSMGIAKKVKDKENELIRLD